MLVCAAASGLACRGDLDPDPPAVREDYAAASPFEGYGNATAGGDGDEVYHVTSLDDSGKGTLRYAVSARSIRPRTVVFDVGGTITLYSDLVIKSPFLTIDGASAPPPGITIRQGSPGDEFVVGGTHDIVISHLRFAGGYQDGRPTSNNSATLVLDGDRKPERRARRIVFDHLSVRGSSDSGPDIWGDVSELTVSWCLFYESLHPMTVSGPGARRWLSLHHNVFARNAERNPQVRGSTSGLDYVNNIVYDWGYFPSARSGHGLRIRNRRSEGRVHANIVNNAFVPRTGFPGWALVYGEEPGPERDEGSAAPARPAQGSVVSGSRLGRLWVSGNLLPPQNVDQYSTVSAALPVPAAARVETWPAAELSIRVLPSVGMKYRDAHEQALIDEVASALALSAGGLGPAAPVPGNASR